MIPIQLAEIDSATLARTGNTPLTEIALVVRGRALPVQLKLEGANPCGSIKDRTAEGLIDDLERRDALTPGSVVVESTSGNLGIAVASIARRRGYRFVAVVDPKITGENLARLRTLGARIECVQSPDEAGCYLSSRLARVQELRESSAAFVWPDQYSNPAGPRAHELGTGPELLEQVRGHLDAIFVPVSTGGTLAGLARCLRRESPETRIVAVDARGSVALGGRPGPRLLTGVGAGRRSSFVTTDLAFCRALAAGTGIRVGGSSGATLAACGHTLAAHPDIGRVVCICPDRGEAYASTIYDDGWLMRHGIEPTSITPGPVVALGRSRPVPAWA